MFTALSPGAVGVQAPDLAAALAAATAGGFGGVEINPREVADLVDQQGAEAVRATFAQAGLRPAGWGLPVNWRGDTTDWQHDLAALPRLARAAAAIGANRTFTWIMPSDDDRSLDENRRFHVERLAPVAAILAEHGCRFGLEFIGPKTLRDSRRYPFIYTAAAMLELAAEIGPNVGLLLDCYHWYTSHGTLADIRALSAAQVPYVHVNDAPVGIDVDAQLDNVRRLPGETGVIDIAGFLQALAQIGYDGPVVPEPFSQRLRDLPSDADRIQVAGESMVQIFALAGITPA